MLKPVEHFHGSDLEKIEKIFHIKKENITSFSANVNPLGISPLLKQELTKNIDVINSYPDREYTSLRKSISDYIHAPIENIVVGNGSTELISLFIQIHHPKKALLLSPTYSEYEREINLDGGTCSYYELKEADDFRLNVEDLKKALTNDIDLLILCNPNNPTSSAINIDIMREILEHCKNNNIFVMIDETYVEFSKNYDEISSIPLTNQFTNMAILRGISKFFASPGLRLGYAICSNQKLLKEMNTLKNPWTINSLAAVAGEIMFNDIVYINATRNLIFSERDRIFELLSSWKNIKVYEANANFILVKILKEGINSYEIFEACIKKGLMIRDCSSFESLGNKFIRFCFMSKEKNTELLEILKDFLQ